LIKFPRTAAQRKPGLQEVQMIYLGSSWIRLLKDKRVGQCGQQVHTDEHGANNHHNSIRNNLQDKLVTQK
jgi:hypothetical protein